MRPFGRNERVPSSPSDDDRVAVATERRLRETAKTATNGMFVKVFYVFLLSMIQCMSIDLQRTWLGSFGQKLIRVFSLPMVSNVHIVWRAQTLRTAVRSCFHFFVDVNGAFCCENPTGRDLFRRWSRKPLALAENNVYFLCMSNSNLARETLRTQLEASDWPSVTEVVPHLITSV